ncbi:uncharacterized protein LOC134464638 [Engraulis encrasicolus]|uniref:uncharacterized protein LOC134464638 n=1 Tax=Engraulis encrasicolus TaxID=184585 RepID=UPI002FD75305
MASTQIVKKKKELTTAAKIRKDTELILAPHANWDKYLTPAPMSVAVLGELVFISAKDDFSINKNPPKDGYKYMKYPDSFKASLMQVCNSGWHAFNDAHNSMDQIRLHTANVPTYVRQAVEIILMDDDKLMTIMLPNVLGTLEQTTSACLSLSESTTKNFKFVVSLVHELLEASTNAHQAYNVDLKKVNQTIQEYTLRQKAKEEASKRSEQELKEFKEKWEKAEKLYDEMMKKMPSGWDMIGMNLAEGMAESLNTLVSGLTNIVTLNFGKMFGDGGSSPSGKPDKPGNSQGPSKVDQYFDAKDIYSRSTTIVSIIEQLKVCFKDGKIDFAQLYDQKEAKAKTDWNKQFLIKEKAEVAQGKECPPKKEALALYDEGISICNKLEEIAPKEQCEPEVEQKIAKDIDDLLVKVKTFDSTGRQLSGSNPMSATPPQLSKGKKRASEYAVENAKVMIEEARKKLDSARDVYTKSIDRLEKNKQEMTDILTTLASADIQKIDFKTTLEFLGLGLKALANVKEQWEKMVQFFQVVTNIIKAALNSATVSFKKQVESAAELHQAGLTSYNSVKFVKDGVYTQAFQVSTLSNLVHLISTTYVEVSDKHIMDRISSLGRLMNLDVSSPEFQRERMTLQSGCKQAQAAIEQLVKKNKMEFQSQVASRLSEITELEALLPPATQEQEKKVQMIVNSPSAEDMDQFY